MQAESDPTMDIPDYPVHLFLSESGYFKKISPASLRMNAEQKLKEDDRIIAHWETTNRTELLFFTAVRISLQFLSVPWQSLPESSSGFRGSAVSCQYPSAAAPFPVSGGGYTPDSNAAA